eukprot:TRINITY_DN6608_c0_g1_i2.p1 TRINITY_DN6608_c0_g1~~TRINITY_DN6608_c0_g1_i2.p1  ORF type:complete len:426 (+),score=112.90 TRINITY_DN6608_c0_g1_i2:208-1485(+)
MSLPAYLGGSEMPSLSEESPGSILQYAEGRKPKACGNCRSAHVGCDMQRPCKRCASKGLQDSCDDYGGKPAPAKARKPAKKKKETEEAEEENANGYQQQAPQRQVNLASPNGAPRPMQPMMPGPSLSQPIGQMGAPMQGVTSPRPALPNQSMSQLQQQQAQKRGRKTKPPTPVMSSPKPPSNLYSGLSFGISPEEMNDPLFNRTLNVYPTPTPVESTEVVPLYESPTFETLSNLVKAEPEEGLASFLSIIQNFNNNAQETPTFENPTTSQQELLQVVKTLQEEIDPDKKTQNTTALDNYLNTFKMATNALAPPSLIWERNGTILFANPAFCHLTGFNMSMIPPKPDSISGFFKMPEYPKFVRDAFFNPNWNETVIHVYLKSWRKESVYLEGSMCVTIKRDALGLPMAIYGHFLTIPIKATQQPSQ